MKSMQNNLMRVRDAMLTVDVPCYHYRRPAEVQKQYIVWQEDSEGDSFDASNVKQEQQIHGTTDYFTQTEFDTAVDAIQNAFNAAEIGFRLNRVEYEDETRLIHYEWEWWVV